MKLKPVFGKTIEQVRRKLTGGKRYIHVGTDVNRRIYVKPFLVCGVPSKSKFSDFWMVENGVVYGRHKDHEFLGDCGILSGHNNRGHFTVPHTVKNMAIIRDIVERQDHAAVSAVCDKKDL